MKDEHNLAKNVSFFKIINFVSFAMVYIASTSWRCTMKDCRAMIHTDANGDVLETSVTHSHIDKVPDVQLDALKTQVKRKAVEQIDARPSKIMRESLACMDNTQNVTTSTPSYQCTMGIVRVTSSKMCGFAM